MFIQTERNRGVMHFGTVAQNGSKLIKGQDLFEPPSDAFPVTVVIARLLSAAQLQCAYEGRIVAFGPEEED